MPWCDKPFVRNRLDGDQRFYVSCELSESLLKGIVRWG